MNAPTATLAPAASPATPAAVARLRRVAAQLAGLQTELSEIAGCVEGLADEKAAPPRPKRTPGPKRPVIVGPDVLHERELLWFRYFALKIGEVSGHAYRRAPGQSVPTSKAFFATRKHINLREFQRWFAPVNGVAAGSGPDRLVRRALNEEIERMEALPAARPALPTSHGLPADSHLRAAGPPLG